MSEYAPPPRSGPDTVPGPELGQPQGPPLAGLTVVDLSRVLAGPLATMLLGDLGAEVIKVQGSGYGVRQANSFKRLTCMFVAM